MKVGSTAYSYRKYLTSGEMTLEAFLDKAVEIGLDCVDLTSYYLRFTLYSSIAIHAKPEFLRKKSIVLSARILTQAEACYSVKSLS